MKERTRGFGMQAAGLIAACMALSACGRTEVTPAAAAGVEPQAATQPAQPATPAHALLFVLPDKTTPADFPQKLAGWKSDGAVSNVVLMRQFGHEVKPGYSLAFNDMAILDFPSEAAYEQWKAASAADLGPDVIVSRADVLLHKQSRHNDPSKSIFVTGVYETLVPKDEYQLFTDDYIEPNMGNQYFSGIMTRYTMYLEREATGGLQNPKAFLVTEYADQAAYDRKSSVKDGYKALLLGGNYPVWAQINDSKKALRRDYSEVYANPVALQ